MNYRYIGNSDLKVSALCLGCMTFADPATDEDTCRTILGRAIERGINFVDTADIYGTDGRSERILGRWLKDSGSRKDLVVATKYRFRAREQTAKAKTERRKVLEACEASLTRLQTDCIDLYQIHMQDNRSRDEDVLRALDDLVRQGKVRHTGCCNYAAHRLVDSLWLSTMNDLPRFATLQVQYSLIERGIEREHVPACFRHGVGIMAWGPLAFGFLAGRHRRGRGAVEGTRLSRQGSAYQRLDNARNWAILSAVRNIARELGATAAQVSLAWLLRRKSVWGVVFGARSVEQLDENVGAGSLMLPDCHVQALDDISAPIYGYPYDMIDRAQGTSADSSLGR